MKAIVLIDDLDLADGGKTIADQTVKLGWDGVWFELDLTDQHAQDLWNGIRPYLEAARRTQRQAVPEAAPDAKAKVVPAAVEGVPRERGVNLYHAAGVPRRTYLLGLRKWAESQGIVIEQGLSEPSGVFYYKYMAEHYAGYEAWLTAQDRDRMRSAG